jgi:hypothetical protein
MHHRSVLVRTLVPSHQYDTNLYLLLSLSLELISHVAAECCPL